MPIPTDHRFSKAAGYRSPEGGLRRFGQATVFAVALVACSVPCSAAQDRLIMGGDAGDLPSLPGEQRGEEADAVNVDTGSIGLTDRSFDNVLGVRLDGYQELAPAVVLEKGWLVSRKLGVGGVYTVQSGSSELVLNGVYAPRRDVRIQFSASQIRMDGVMSDLGGNDETLVQTGMLSSVRKQWTKSRVLPEAAFAVFTARAGGSRRREATLSGIEMGTNAGYMLKVAAMPMVRARVEVSYQGQSTTYDNPLTAHWRDSQASASVNYAQSFDDCSLIRGRFTTGPGVSRTDLRYEKGAFSVGFLQSRSDDYQDRMLQFSYSLALDSGRRPVAKCEHIAGAPTPFRAIVDAATTRPSYLPSEPLTRTVSADDVPS
jgi:hypothetical protein